MSVAIEQCGIVLGPKSINSDGRHLKASLRGKLDEDGRLRSILDCDLRGGNDGELLKRQRMFWIADGPNQIYVCQSE